jgi:hypothetical protein
LDRNAASDIVECFSELLKRQLIVKIKNSNFVTFAIDESTDVNSKSQLVLSVRFKYRFRFYDTFLNMFEIQVNIGQYISGVV